MCKAKDNTPIENKDDNLEQEEPIVVYIEEPPVLEFKTLFEANIYLACHEIDDSNGDQRIFCLEGYDHENEYRWWPSVKKFMEEKEERAKKFMEEVEKRQKEIEENEKRWVGVSLQERLKQLRELKQQEENQ